MTAVESALLFIPYILLSVSVIELALVYAAASLLEGATGSAARLVRTGQVQQASGDPQAMFQQALCNYAVVLVPCNEIVYEVRQMNSFSDFGEMGAEFDESGNMVSGGFDPGGSGDRVLIRSSFRYEMMTPFVGRLLAGADNSILFVSTIVLQTEPYEFEIGEEWS